MAKSEIPSIVVHGGSGSSEGGGCAPDMDRGPSRPSRLAKQDEVDLDEEASCALSPVTIHIEDGGGSDGMPDRCLESDYLGDEPISSDGESPSRTQSPSSGSRQSPALSSAAGNQGKGDKVHSQSQSKGSNKQGRLSKQGSSQGSLEGSSPSLSRDSSTETYTDSTGIDLQQFIIETLHKNQKDRMMLLKIEQDLINLVKDNKRQSMRFPQMSSYHRMLVHRVAAYFGLDHNVDQNGTAVIVNKTRNTRLPDTRFKDQIREELLPEEPKKSILKRDSASFEEGKESPERQSSSDSRRSKSIEEREEEYEKARARIFNKDEGVGESPVSRSSQEDLRWTSEPRPWSSTDSDSSGRPPQQQGSIHTGSSFEYEAEGKGGKSYSLLTKMDSDSKETLAPNKGIRPPVTKASSFGGISVLNRDSSLAEAKSAVAKLTKAESFNVSSLCTVTHLSTTVSVSSATPCQPIVAAPPLTAPQSLQSSAAVNPQSYTPVIASQQLPNQVAWQGGGRELSSSHDSSMAQPTVWSLPGVEAGSIIINPQTGVPILSPDGSLYRPRVVSPIVSHPVMVGPFQPQVPLSQNIIAQQQQQQVAPPQQQVSAPAPPPPPHQQPQPPPPPPPPQQHHPSLQQPRMQHHHHHHQQQQLQSVGNINQSPTVVYIPYIQQISPNLSQQSLLSQQDSRHFETDTGSANVSDITNQLSALSFLSSQSINHQDGSNIAAVSAAASHGTVLSPTTNTAGLENVQNIGNPQAMNSQGFLLPSIRGQNFINQQPGVAQGPVYYLHQMTPVSCAPTVRYLYPSSSVQQPVPVALGQVANQGPVGDAQHGSASAQNTAQQSPSLTGHVVPILSYAHTVGENLSSPFFTYTVASQSDNTTVTTTSATPTSVGMSLPVYPYIIPGNAPNPPLLNSPSASQVVPPVALPSPPSAAMPMYVVTANTAPPSASAATSPYISFRPQTPPSQQSSNGNQASTSSSLPFVGYTLYSALQPQQIPTPTAMTPGVHTSTSQFTPTIMTAFQVLRPSIPLVSGVRNNTPPPPLPQTVITPQFSTPPPNSTKPHPLSFTMVKPGELHPSAELFAGGVVSEDQHKAGRSHPINPMGSGGNRQPTAGSIYRRGIPLLPDVRLIGHPLQHQINQIVIPPNRAMPRFSAATPSHSSSRPPKVRKQRNKVGAMNRNDSTSSQGAGDQNAGAGHILEVEGIPDGMKRNEAERYLEPVAALGARIQFLCLDGSSGASPAAGDSIMSSKHQVLAVFESSTAAQSALLNIKTTKFQLRPLGQGASHSLS